MTYRVNWSRPNKFEEGNLDVDLVGVYLIGYRDTATDKRYVVYVGKGHIEERLAHQYRTNPCIQRKLSLPDRVGYYRFAVVHEEEDRLDIELALYRRYGGSQRLCNRIEPSGSGRTEEMEIVETFPPASVPVSQAIQRRRSSHEGILLTF